MTEIIITIKKRAARAKTSLSNTQSPKPLFSLRGEKHPLKRRLKKQDGFIRFYDLGQKLISGNWTTNDFVVAPVPEYNSDPGSDNRPYVRSLDLSDFANRDAEILPGTANLETEARIIERAQGDYFQIEASGDNFSQMTLTSNENWTDSGLSLTAEQLADSNFKIRTRNFGISGFKALLFENEIVLTGSGKNKITASNSYGADTVAFTPKANDSYFLLPFLNFVFGQIADSEIKAVGYVYSVFPRDVDTAEVQRSIQTTDFESYEAVYNRAADTPQIKAFRYNPLPVEELPFLSALNETEFTNGSFLYLSQNVTRPFDDYDMELIEGRLVCIIRQGGQNFYVWS